MTTRTEAPEHGSPEHAATFRRVAQHLEIAASRLIRDGEVHGLQPADIGALFIGVGLKAMVLACDTNGAAKYLRELADGIEVPTQRAN